MTSQTQAANLTLTGYKPYLRGQPNVLAFASLVSNPASDPYRAGSNGETRDHLPWLPVQARPELGAHGDRIQVKLDEAEDLSGSVLTQNTCKVGRT